MVVIGWWDEEEQEEESRKCEWFDVKKEESEFELQFMRPVFY